MQGMLLKEPLFKKAEAGEKTQTRRLILPQPTAERYTAMIGGHGDIPYQAKLWTPREPNNPIIEDIKPRYKKGEIVYLKEPYRDDLSMDKALYKYDTECVTDLMNRGFLEELKSPGFWKNKLFMPESMARYFIEITDVRCERVASISRADAIAEGIETVRQLGKTYYKLYCGKNKQFDYDENPIVSFWSLWDSINGKPKLNQKTGIYESFPFNTPEPTLGIDIKNKELITIPNPWVFAYTFKLVEP